MEGDFTEGVFLMQGEFLMEGKFMVAQFLMEGEFMKGGMEKCQLHGPHSFCFGVGEAVGLSF